MELINVIIVEDSEDDLLLLLRALHKGGFEPVYSRVETKKALSERGLYFRWACRKIAGSLFKNG